jgi:hypothetical protein
MPVFEMPMVSHGVSTKILPILFIALLHLQVEYSKHLAPMSLALPQTCSMSQRSPKMSF